MLQADFGINLTKARIFRSRQIKILGGIASMNSAEQILITDDNEISTK